MKRIAVMVILVGMISGAFGQVVRPGVGPIPAFGPVAILITSPESGTGLGPKKDLGEQFDLAFKLQVANLTVSDVELYVLEFNDENETYTELTGEWIVDKINTSWDVLRGPLVTDGSFTLEIPERGYYFLKIRANYTLEGRQESAEGGDIIFGPRIRVIPKLGQRSYAVLLGMPTLPLVVGVAVRTVRRRETRQRRRRQDPRWLEELKERQDSREEEG